MTAEGGRRYIYNNVEKIFLLFLKKKFDKFLVCKLNILHLQKKTKQNGRRAGSRQIKKIL